MGNRVPDAFSVRFILFTYKEKIDSLYIHNEIVI